MANDPGFLPPVLNAPLAARIANLPRILAGPILRKVDASSVTVWIALRTPDLVGLQVRTTTSQTPVLSAAFKAPVKLGEQLYVTAITASSPTPVLSTNVLYVYEPQFQPTGTSDTFDLRTPGYWNAGTPSAGAKVSSDVTAQFSYGGIGEPCFCLPPDDPTSLRILHGSCRKAHADSVDGLATVDDYLTGLNGEPPAQAPAITLSTRPHQLIFTGDQIYADDTAHVLLGMLTDAATTLIGAPELIPLLGADGTSPAETTRFGPMTRQGKIANEGGFTTTAGYSHLISFGEFAAMYLFMYSDVLWPTTLPTFEELFRISGPNGSQPAPRQIPRAGNNTRAPSTVPDPNFTASEAQRPGLISFQTSLPKVRRALANMPTYMIFDDHDITDDWYMNRQFCQQVIPSPLGTRIIQNGLAAYAFFQGWGNVGSATGAGDVTPVTTAFQAWQQAAFPVSGAEFDSLSKVIGMPTGPLAPASGTNVVQLTKDSSAVKWYYALSWTGHELIVMDSRTLRGYPSQPLQNAALIADASMPPQLGIPLPSSLEQKISIVVAPAPVNGGEPAAEQVQALARKAQSVFGYDVENWKGDPTAFETLLSTLAVRGQRQRRYVVLSGDLHYGFAHRFQYWSSAPLTNPGGGPAAATFALMTSSALKNETGESFPSDTRTAQRFGFITLNPNITRNATRVAFNRLSTDPAIGSVPVGKIAGTNTSITADLDRAIAVIPDLAEDLAEFGNDNTIADARFSRQPTTIEKSQLLHTELTQSVSTSPTTDKTTLAAVVNGVVQTVKAYFDVLSPGNEFVGVNNVGLIRFEMRPNPVGVTSLFAIQELRWWPGTVKDAYKGQNQTPYRPPGSVTQFAVDLTIEAAPTFPGV